MYVCMCVCNMYASIQEHDYTGAWGIIECIGLKCASRHVLVDPALHRKLEKEQREKEQREKQERACYCNRVNPPSSSYIKAESYP